MKINHDMQVRGKIQADTLDGAPTGELQDRIMQSIAEYTETVVAPQIAAVQAEFADRLSALTERYNGAVEKYNAAVETINKLAERVTALENNYDPTIIE